MWKQNIKALYEVQYSALIDWTVALQTCLSTQKLGTCFTIEKKVGGSQVNTDSWWKG